MPVEDPSRCYGSITLRRAQVLRRLAEMKTEAEIATELGLALSRVRSHVSDLKQLVGVRTTRDLGRWWQTRRLEWLSFYANEAGVPAGR